MSINIENFKLARQWVAECEHFDMGEWLYIDKKGWKSEVTGCGTAMCIGGTIEFKLSGSDIDIDEDGEKNAEKWLGLNYRESSKLFYGDENYYKNAQYLSDVTKQMALDKLDAIIEAGEFV